MLILNLVAFQSCGHEKLSVTFSANIAQYTISSLLIQFAIQSILLVINESLRVSDIKRGQPQEIFACRGEGHGQLRVTMITPPPTPARLVKLKKEEHRFSIYLFILLFTSNYIVLITMIWQNWVAGKAEPMPARVAVSLGGSPRVAVSLEATLY